MINFNVADPIAASEIGQWCNQQLGESAWKLSTAGLFSKSPVYKFSLYKEKDATLFSLKWAEFV